MNTFDLNNLRIPRQKRAKAAGNDSSLSDFAVKFIEIWNDSDSMQEICSRTGQKRTAARGMFRKLSKQGVVLKTIAYDMHGENNSRWNGGRRTRKDGYILVYSPSHPCAYRNFVLEHRLVMEAHLNRYLEPHELVHHINEIKDDNRLENLKLETRSTHATKHFKGRRFTRWEPKATKEQIIELYCEQQLTIKECARVLGLKYGAMRKHFIEFEIPFRTTDPWHRRRGNRACDVV